MILHYESLPSTQDFALDLVRQRRREVEGVRADEQTAGRGRRDAEWHSPAGVCLAVSYILWDEPVPGLPWALGMRMAAACASVLDRATGITTQLRWPNDLLLDSKKVAGILVETVEGVAVIGVGINANIGSFPPNLEASATSLQLVTNRPHDIGGLEKEIREGFPLVTWEQAIAAFHQRDATTGKRFQAADGRAGTALGIDRVGLLRIRWEDGSEETIPAAQPI